jgi:hypothetical protein
MKILLDKHTHMMNDSSLHEELERLVQIERKRKRQLQDRWELDTVVPVAECKAVAYPK